MSCRQKDDSAVTNKYAAQYVLDLNTSDTFRFEFPFRFNYRTGKIDSSDFFQRRNFARMIGLENLENGTDSVCIRMFYSRALLSEFLMLELKNTEGKWIAEVSKIKAYFNSEKEIIDSFSRQVEPEYPKSGWVMLISQLFSQKVLSLDDQKIIPRNLVTAMADGEGIDFEIATHNTYRAYGYANPAFQPKAIWQVNNVNSIKDILWTEFSLLKKWDDQIIQDFRDKVTENQLLPSPAKKESMVILQEVKK